MCKMINHNKNDTVSRKILFFKKTKTITSGSCDHMIDAFIYIDDRVV